MSSSLFQLPEELISTLTSNFPCRDAQIRALATLLSPSAAPCRALILHGPEATGKTSITTDLLAGLSADPSEPNPLRHAIVKSEECVTARHLFERTIALVADALQWHDRSTFGRCETAASFAVSLSQMLNPPRGNQQEQQQTQNRFVLVFDGIDRQREASPTLVPALARLTELIPHLTIVFIVTSPPPSLLRLSAPPQIYFPPYAKSEYLSILSSRDPAPQPLPNTTQAETSDLYTRFAAAVHDSLTRPASRTLPGLRHACAALWPRFTAPVASGTHKAREFSKLLVASRVYFQDESILEPGLTMRRALRPAASSTTTTNTTTTAAATTSTTSTINPKDQQQPSTTITPTPKRPANADLASLLPLTPRLILLASYLASHNPPRHDQTVFSTWHNASKRRGGGGGRLLPPKALSSAPRGPRPKHRKIARKLLGPGVFVLERMVAIYVATRREWAPNSSNAPGEEEDQSMENIYSGGGAGVDADVAMAIATLSSLRLLVRVGAANPGAAASGAGGGLGGAGGDLDRGGKWRVNVGWEVIRGVGRSMGVEVEDWLVE